jgi:Asp-tRNA(Asn)/Glu-tRNA(Gln) amidotransferase A subunit family amidase
VDNLRSASAPIDEIELPDSFRGLLEAQRIIMAVEMATSLGFEREEHGAKLGPELRELCAQGDAHNPCSYQAARSQAEQCRRLIAGMFAKLDVLLTPSALGEAPASLGSTGDPAFNRIWTLLHLPCINLPVGRGAQGLPIGIQLVGSQHRDAALCSAATWIDSALRRP